MTAPRARDDDRLVEEVAEVVREAMLGNSMCMCGEVCQLTGCGCSTVIAKAALTVARAHFAALSRAHGAAIRGRIDMGDGPATVERFEWKAKGAEECAELIEGEK